MSDLLEYVGSNSQSAEVMALNDYHATLDIRELAAVPVLVAIKNNGSYMRVRDKGPLWIVYPFEDLPLADQSRHQANQVWQLRRIELH
ncbi:MAG: hypothetical protein GYB21_15585 [Oceanospirillales bacterium]|nr:hypothetical protein [Oceanospirillales bacterium]